MIVSRLTIRTDNGRAALTLSNLNKHLGQLEVEFIDNVNIKKVHLGKKGLHLNKKGKNPVDTGRKLNVHKTFQRRPGRLLNVLCTFNLGPVSTGNRL